MTAFWLQDPTVLFNNTGITQIIPTSDMNRDAKLNAISRLIILMTLLGYLFTMSIKLLLLGAIALAMIALLHTAQSNATATGSNATGSNATGSNATATGTNGDKKEGFANYANYNTGRRRMVNQPVSAQPSALSFQAPTPQDPLMNVLLTDIKDRPTRPAAEPAFNPQVEHEINETTQQFVVQDLGSNPNLEDRLFRDLGDNFEFNNSMRSYFATPNTKIPNDQHAFAEYCYGSMISCKEGNMMACARANPVLGSITGAQ